jgi:hypothetical protein
MRRLALVLAVVTAFPLSPVSAAPPKIGISTWVVERVKPNARALSISGGASAWNHDYAFAAVASVSLDKDGRFADAEGGLFYGAAAESGVFVRTPAGDVACGGLPNGGTACHDGLAGAGIAFAIWWDNASFNKVFVVLRGSDRSAKIDTKSSPGWRIRPWTGPVRVVTNADYGSVMGPLGTGVTVSGDATAAGGSTGSVAIGHPACASYGVAAAGSGVVTLQGGTKDVTRTCPKDVAPPAAAAPGGTEWTLSGASAGQTDVPTRLIVIEPPPRRR